jgi:adenine-specific DNA-methyltransferase
MKKLTAHDPETKSPDLFADNLAQLKALFPELVTEGKAGASVNVDVLKALVGDKTVTDAEEKYGLNWHGKRQARQLALTPSTGTLRPCPEESVDWDTTQNLMIEGDNLEVLKLLQKSYAGKVKLIYIDPPYNTGHDFVYPDNFQDNIKNYLELTGQTGEGGNKLSSNTESSGRFHTDWLNMMYPRLKLAKNLLRKDGIIYVSVDSVEVSRLMVLGHEVFGEENFLECLTRVSKLTSNKGVHFSPACDYILAYAKSADDLPELSDASAQEDEEYVGLFRFEDKRGKYNEVSLYMPSLDFRPNQRYLIQCPDGSKVITPDGRVFRWTKETLQKNLAEDRVVFKKTNTSPLLDAQGQKALWNVYTKIYLHERLEKGLRPATLLDKKTFTNSTASKELIRLGVPFPFSKPFELIAHLIEISGCKTDDIILDCFGGSGTSGDAVMRLGAANKIQCRYILVQLPETLDANNKDQNEAATFCDQLGKLRAITELTKERLRRAGKKIRDENPLFAGDLGFRVFKLASSNIQTWEPAPGKLTDTLESHVEHLKTERTENDILFELLLKLGLDLTVAIEEKTIAGKKVQSVGAGTLLVCLAPKIGRKDAEPLALGMAAWHKELAPAGECTVVFKDSAFADDVAKTNLAAILEQHGLGNVRSL